MRPSTAFSRFAVAGVIAGGLALAAAGPVAAQAPKKGGVLSYAISAETPNYDCIGSDTFATMHFVAPFYSQLLKFDLSNYPKVKGDLAESWTVASDLMSYTFKLKSGVTFHDGTPLTSA